MTKQEILDLLAEQIGELGAAAETLDAGTATWQRSAAAALLTARTALAFARTNINSFAPGA